jgi:hypothetical protein
LISVVFSTSPVSEPGGGFRGDLDRLNCLGGLFRHGVHGQEVAVPIEVLAGLELKGGHVSVDFL